MSHESAFAAYDHLSLSVREAMIAVIESIIETDDLQQINSSRLGNRVLKRKSSEGFKKCCGEHARQCFGILLRDYLEEQDEWSSPVEEEVAGGTQKVYYREQC